MQNLCEILNCLVVGAECKMREVQAGSFFMLDNLSTNFKSLQPVRKKGRFLMKWMHESSKGKNTPTGLSTRKERRCF